MIFLVYSPLQDQSIAHSLGVADYSYYFVMKRFVPLLKEFGQVRILDEMPNDKLVAQVRQEGPCLLFCFTPPHKLPVLEQCPVVPVFAWEYSTIPYESFGQDSDNWEMCLERAGQAITHSSYSKQVVRAQLGDSYNITSIPAPLWDKYEGIREFRARGKPGGLEALDLKCTVIDSADYEIAGTLIKPAESAGRSRAPVGEAWNGEFLDYRFGCDDNRPGMVGFNTPENWGCWSKSGYPWILLNQLVSGRIEVTFTGRGYAHHIGRVFTLRVGDASADLILSEDVQTHTLAMHVTEPTNFISFEGISEPASGGEDPRDLAVGFVQLDIKRLESPANDIGSAGAVGEDKTVENLRPELAETILYTSIFNPQDGRKNWEDIITSFVYAFRDCPECTLLVKITNQQIGSILEDIFKFFMELSPFRCRLVFLHGYLEDGEYENLMVNSHYIVNASRGEGQCLPLMEFMSSGVPAVAPKNSAMGDYMLEGAGFVVESSPELTFWPHDPRQPYRTCWDRINWESLVHALRQSRELVQEDLPGYREMARQAAEAQRQYCSMDVGRARLRDFLESLAN